MRMKNHNPAQDEKEVHAPGAEMKVMRRAVPVFRQRDDPFGVVQDDHDGS
jgi:hypothetical protein